MRNLSKPNLNCKFCEGRGQTDIFGKNGQCGLCWNFTIQTGNDSVSRMGLVEMVIGLQSALAQRNDCPECGGKGIQYVGVDVEAEPCHCHNDAWTILNHYGKSFKMVIDEYLWLSGIDTGEIEKEWKTIEAGLLERLKGEFLQR